MATTHLITGPQWVTKEIFDATYADQIKSAFHQGAHFIVGAAKGVDAWTQELLNSLLLEQSSPNFERVTVYNVIGKDQRINEKFLLVNTFAKYPERDLAALAAADNNVITYLFQWGSAASGVMLPVLASLIGAEDAKRVHAELRRMSEPPDKQLTASVAQLYQEKFRSSDKD